MNGRRQGTRWRAPLGLALTILVFWFVVWPRVLAPAISATTGMVVRQEERVELAVAALLAPAFEVGDNIRRASAAVPESKGATGPSATQALQTPSFLDTKASERWKSLPFERKWLEYQGEDMRALRLTTRGLLGFPVLILVTTLMRVAPLRALLRLGWFAIMLPLSFRRISPKGTHGTARWADDRELDELRPRKNEPPLVLGTVQHGLRRRLVAIPEKWQYEHTLVVAPTGSGKTSSLIIPNLLTEPGTRSLVVTDPKRELIRKTSPKLIETYGRDRVKVLDFYDPDISVGYNPLAYVHDMTSATLFADTWVRNTGVSQKDPFWASTNRQIMAAVALHLVKTSEVTPPLAELAYFLQGRTPEEIREELARSPVPEVRLRANGALASMERNERLVGSVFAELAGRFEVLDDERVRTVTATNELDIASFGEQPSAVYIAMHLERSRHQSPLTASFFLHFFTALMDQASASLSGSLRTSVMCYLDEFGVLGNIPSFASRLATIRSAGIGCVLVVQDYAQLVSQYGDEDAEAIRTNATNKVCLSGVTGDDAKYFSELSGTSTVLSSHQSSHRPILVPWATAGDRSIAETQRPLITPDELTNMGDSIFVKPGHLPPVLAKQRRYYREAGLKRWTPDDGQCDSLAALSREHWLPVPAFMSFLQEPDLMTPSSPWSMIEPEPPPVYSVPARQAGCIHSREPDAATSASGRDRAHRLTPTELRVLSLVEEGKTNAEIAAELNYKVQSVRNVLATIYIRVGVQARGEQGRREAIRIMREGGIRLGDTVSSDERERGW